MAVLLSGTGSLPSRLGKFIKLVRSIQGMTAETLPVGSVDDAGAIWGTGGATVNDFKTAFNAIEAQFQSALQAEVDGLYELRDNIRTAIIAQLPDITAMVSHFIIEQVHADANLPVKDITSALKELNRQMVGTSDSIDANATSVSVAAETVPANYGNATVVATVKNGKGVTREYVYAEVMELKVTSDAGTTGITAGTEPCSLKGELAESNKLNWNWPDGSGASTTLSITDPSLDAQTTGNLLNNSDFEAWAGLPESNANMPSYWTKVTGTIGTDIKKNVANLYSSRTSSTAALELVGDGAVLHSMYQKFGSSTTGTSKTLLPNTVYAVNAFFKRSAAMTGTVVMSLVDSSNAVINDDAGTANTITKDLSTLGASYEAVNGFFITPKSLPSDYRLIIRGTVAIQNAKSLYIDDLAMVACKEAYARGPYVAAFRGSTDVAKNDLFKITCANDYGGILQTYGFWAMLNCPGLDPTGFDVQIASNAAGGETLADSLAS